MRSEAEQVREALREIVKGSTDHHVANGAARLAKHAPDETLLKLRRLLR